MLPIVKLIGRMMETHTAVMITMNTSRCLWNLMYWMASIPHLLRIMSSDKVNTLTIQEHIPRSTSEKSPVTMDSLSLASPPPSKVASS